MLQRGRMHGVSGVKLWNIQFRSVTGASACASVQEKSNTSKESQPKICHNYGPRGVFSLSPQSSCYKPILLLSVSSRDVLLLVCSHVMTIQNPQTEVPVLGHLCGLHMRITVRCFFCLIISNLKKCKQNIYRRCSMKLDETTTN